MTIDVDAQIKNPTAIYGWRLSDSAQRQRDHDLRQLQQRHLAPIDRKLVINYEK